MPAVFFTTAEGEQVAVTWEPGGTIDGPAELLTVARQLAAEGMNVAEPTFVGVRASLDTSGPVEAVQLTAYRAGVELGWRVVELDPELPDVAYDAEPGIVY